MNLRGVLAVAACLAWPVAGVGRRTVRITHVTIVSPERKAPLRDATVTLRDGRIAAITTGAVSEGRCRRPGRQGLYLTPGLIDSHVHLGGMPGMNEEQEAKHPGIVQGRLDVQTPAVSCCTVLPRWSNLFSTPKRHGALEEPSPWCRIPISAAARR